MKAIIFDLGNVLVRYDHGRVLAALADVCRLPASVLGEITADLSHDLNTGAMGVQELHRYLIDRAGATEDPDRFLDALCAGMVRDDRALAYAVELQARSQVTVAVISNTNEAHVRWLDEHVGELRELDLVMMSNEVGLLKPDPAIYELALELLDVEPDRALFIDDVAAYVEAARALGLAGIVHVNWHDTRAGIEGWLQEDRPARSAASPR